MNKYEKEKWWELIKRVAHELSIDKIPYHFDASTSLFVQGIDFDMDDIDVLIQWDHFKKAHNYFIKYGASPIQNSGFSHFFFMQDNLKVHILSHESCTNLEEDLERVIVKSGNQVIWAKSVEFYRRHHPDNHPLAGLIDDFLARRNMTS